MLNGTVLAGEDPNVAEIVAIGTWALQLHLYAIPQLTRVASYALGGEVMPRRRVGTELRRLR